MTTTAEAIYEDGVLRLLTPVPFANGTRLTAALIDIPAPERRDAAYLLTLPHAERHRILAEAAAPEYEADLALPVAERELTPFTALGGEPFLLDYITIEPGKRSSKPCIRGLRMTVYDVLEYLASGMTEAEILQDFPDLTAQDIRACLAFAADRKRQLVSISIR